MMENKEKNFVSAVLYVHNQELYLADFLRKINTILRENFENYEIICVDDRSTDRSVQVIAEFSKIHQEASVSIIHMS